VPAHRVDELTTGMPATVIAEDGVERAATVEEISPEVDRTTREAQVRLVFAEGPQALRPGDWVAVRFRRRNLSATRFRLPMSRGDIGNYLGLVVETVSRVFTRLQGQGIIEVLGKEIAILDPVALGALAGKQVGGPADI